MVAKEEEVVGGMDGEFGISSCKPLHVDWINKKALLNMAQGTAFHIL